MWVTSWDCFVHKAFLLRNQQALSSRLQLSYQLKYFGVYCPVEDLIYQHVLIIYTRAIKSSSEIRQKGFHAGVLYTNVINFLLFFLSKQGKFAKRNVCAGVSHHKGTTNLHKKSRLMILMILNSINNHFRQSKWSHVAGLLCLFTWNYGISSWLM